MKTIFKYPIRPTSEQQVEMPNGSQIIHVGKDPDGQPCVWATVDTAEKRMINVDIIMVGTGAEMPEGKLTHKGTLIVGPLVLHVFVANPDKRIL